MTMLLSVDIKKTCTFVYIFVLSRPVLAYTNTIRPTNLRISWKQSLTTLRLSGGKLRPKLRCDQEILNHLPSMPPKNSDVLHFHDGFPRCCTAVHSTEISDSKTERAPKDGLIGQLISKGQGALLAYGVLNVLYYTSLTAIAWYATRGSALSSIVGRVMSLEGDGHERLHISFWKLSQAAARIARLSAIVWAGSQVTKIFRVSGAFFLSPWADILLEKFEHKFRTKSRNEAFQKIISLLLLSTALFYTSLIFISASISR